MSAQIIDLELDMQLANNLKKIHQSMVQMGIATIKSNIDSNSIHSLKHFVINLLTSPEMLAVLSQPELLDLWDSINDELLFRRQERSA